MPLDPNRATAVYRFFDRQGHLMYVGIAYDPAERWKHHAAKTRWWKDAADNTIEWYDTRAEAERAEKSRCDTRSRSTTRLAALLLTRGRRASAE